RQQLADAERLGEVVVCSRVERGDLVPLLSPRGDDDDRRARPLPDATGQVDAVAVRETQVQENDVGILASDLRQALSGRRSLDQAVRLVLQGGPQEAAHLGHEAYRL